jgi:hypothetical protein
MPSPPVLAAAATAAARTKRPCLIRSNQYTNKQWGIRGQKKKRISETKTKMAREKRKKSQEQE